MNVAFPFRLEMSISCIDSLERQLTSSILPFDPRALSHHTCQLRFSEQLYAKPNRKKKNRFEKADLYQKQFNLSLHQLLENLQQQFTQCNPSTH